MSRYTTRADTLAYGCTHGGGMGGQEHAADYCRTAAVTASRCHRDAAPCMNDGR